VSQKRNNIDHRLNVLFTAIPPWIRLFSVMVLQVGLVLLANVLAVVLRFEFRVPDEFWQLTYDGMPVVAVVFGLGLLTFKVHRGLWRYCSFHDLKLIIVAGIVSTVVFYVVLHGLLGWVFYPKSIIVLTGLLSIIFLGIIRFTVRIFRDWNPSRDGGSARVLIIGAGSAGEKLVRDLMHNPSYYPVGFVDDNANKHGRTIHGVEVIGSVADIPDIARRYRVTELIVAVPSASSALMQRVLTLAVGSRLSIKTLPSTKEILNYPRSGWHVREMILDDLLNRQPIRTDLEEVRSLLAGQCVLVTGAGGSIGSELCRQILQARPSKLVMFEKHENSLFALDMNLRELFPEAEIIPVVGDVMDTHGVRATFRLFAPQLIFHAAAYKHVPMMEQNKREAVRNNIIGSQVVMSAAQEFAAKRFVLISTDKAVNPTNVMGATKRVAEYLAQSMRESKATRFSVVRFGNVLGSSGSVVPLFAEQIKKGGPVTVTHPDIRRFFMLIPEAVQLILQASVMGEGGDVFVLDMGKQVRIADLARNMIAISGFSPDRDIKVKFTNLRPGEKLYEELFEQDERVISTSHVMIKRIVSGQPFKTEELNQHIAELEACLAYDDTAFLVRMLQKLVPSYCPNGAEQGSCLK